MRNNFTKLSSAEEGKGPGNTGSSPGLGNSAEQALWSAGVSQGRWKLALAIGERQVQLPGTCSSGTPVTGGHAYVILPATDLVPGTSLYLILANCAILSCLFFLGFPPLYLSQENLIPWDFLRGIFFFQISHYSLMSS